jgi:16S rRNA (uracil1498-N3)-methyltransferase
MAALLAAAPAGMRITLVEPGADGRSGRSIQRLPRSEAVELLVGPEGGWTSAELELAASQRSMLLTLGSQTLRAVSAPLVAISALRAVWDDF